MANIVGTKYNDSIGGTNDFDTMYGLGGHDVLFGSNGADYMDGGEGYDSVDYSFSEVGVGVSLVANRGYGGMAEGDWYVSIAGMIGSLHNDSFVGNAEYNEVYGQSGNDVLDGREGGDKLLGEIGNDLLKGGGGDDYLDGGENDDTFFGGLGNDTLIGGTGRDTVDYSDASNDVRVNLELSYASGANGYDILGGMENITGSAWWDTLVGDAGANVIRGLDGVDSLAGRGGNDTLDGGKGDDVLNGGTGADTMTGGVGNDQYVVDEVGDVVIEAAGEGTDGIYSAMSYTLRDNFENLALDPAAGAINGTGNAARNEMFGNDSANILDGRGGADWMTGKGGNDWYFVDNPNDWINDFASGTLDRAFTSVDYALGEYAEIEIFSTTLHAGTAPLNLTGNALNNTIYGNAGSNALKGLNGNDTLVGLGGADAFVFNTMPVLNTNVDLIDDFNVADDDIVLASWVFTALPPGTLAAGAFSVGTEAADATDRIIYDIEHGTLIYDSNGNAAGGGVPFAVVDPGLAITNADFIIV